MNSVSPHSYFAYQEAFVPGAAMLVKLIEELAALLFA